MDESEVIEELIGELLAVGYSNDEILTKLVETGCTVEEATQALRHIYNTWAENVIALDLQPTDLLNWHIQQRHQLLQKLLVNGEYKTVLSVLDSLAAIQGLTGVSEAPKVPLPVYMVEKKEDDKQDRGDDGGTPHEASSAP